MKRVRKFWLEPGLVIRGAEGESPQEQQPVTGEAPEGSNNEEVEDTESPDEGDDDDEPAPTKEDVKKLKEAARKERVEKRALAKELKELKGQKQTEQVQEETKQVEQQQRVNDERLAKLAAGFRDARVEQVVAKVAAALNAASPEDVYDHLKLRNFPDIDVDQDDDDPTKVTVDEDDVKAAVKKVLKAKPHWVKGAAGDGTPSGSQFRPGGSRKPELDKDALQSRFPALKNR